MDLPFKEYDEKKYLVRVFKEHIDDSELVWHKDREDRIVKSLSHTDWMIQLDDELPKPLTEMIFIPKGVYHRVIKGGGDLTIRVNKIL